MNRYQRNLVLGFYTKAVSEFMFGLFWSNITPSLIEVQIELHQFS